MMQHNGSRYCLKSQRQQAIQTLTFETRSKTFLVKMSFICIENENSFLYQQIRTQPRFETEVLGNSELAYSVGSSCSKGQKNITLNIYRLERLKRWITFPLDSSIGFPHTYPLHSDLSAGLHSPAFEKKLVLDQRARGKSLSYSRLPITRILAYSNLPLTRSNFCFPSGPGSSNVGSRYPPDKNLSWGQCNWFP